MKNLSPHSDIATPKEILSWKKDFLKRQDLFIEAASQDTGRSFEESFLYDWMPVEAGLDFLRDNIPDFSEGRVLKSGMPPYLGRRTLVERRIPWGEVLI